LVIIYDQANDKFGAGKFKPMWHEPYIVKRVLQKGTYELVDYKGNVEISPVEQTDICNVLKHNTCSTSTKH